MKNRVISGIEKGQDSRRRSSNIRLVIMLMIPKSGVSE